MEKRQSNIWLTEEAKGLLTQWAEHDHLSQSDIVEKLIREEAARRSRSIVEQQSLPVIREIIQSELRKQLAQQRMDMREDLHLEITQEFQAIQRASDNRLAALLVRIGRDVHVAYRLAFSHLALAYGRARALEVYEDARERAGAALSRKGNDEV